jgi:hypothetical protein
MLEDPQSTTACDTSCGVVRIPETLEDPHPRRSRDGRNMREIRLFSVDQAAVVLDFGAEGIESRGSSVRVASMDTGATRKND